MYNPKDIQFVGKYDYDKQAAEKMADKCQSFSVGVFRWVMKSNGKEMKRDSVLIRIKGKSENRKQVFDRAEKVINALEAGNFVGSKIIEVK